MDLKNYWKQIRELEHALTVEHPEGGVYLVHSESNRVMVVSPYVAAQCLHRQTHRRANDAEIADYQEAQAREGARIAAQGRRMSYVNQDQSERSKNARAYQL